MDKVNLQGWIGREETREGTLSSDAVAAWLSTMSHHAAQPPKFGQTVPLLAHWIAFNPRASMDDLGADGHPRLKGFLPPVDLPRRMWAGGSLQFAQPIHVGEALTKRSVLRGINEKVGGTGRMIFVTVDHEIHGENGLAISERQDIVYLPMPKKYTPPKAIAAPLEPDATEHFDVTTARLFRYSAVTFNAHRIHYDLPYARDVEKLPGLVVHGPLQATALAHFASRVTGSELSAFRFRSIHPLFHDQHMNLVAMHEGEQSLHLCTAAARDGHVGMQATAGWGAN